jgi:5-methylcytosine-specific restriction endonuclease McrA
MRIRRRLRREGGTRVCGLCGGPVDMTLPHGDPLAFELDHVHARSLGGPDHPTNLRIAHARCNKQRGNGRQTPRTIPADRSANW